MALYIWKVFLLLMEVNSIWTRGRDGAVRWETCIDCQASPDCDDVLDVLYYVTTVECQTNCLKNEACNLVEFPLNHKREVYVSCGIYNCNSTISSEHHMSMIAITIECGYPPKPDNGRVELDITGMTAYGSTAVQSCDEGYELIGDETLLCHANGSWSASATCKIIDCGEPITPSNGRLTLAILSTSRRTTYGAGAIVVCEHGYALRGDSVIRCQSNGSWSASAKCISKGTTSLQTTISGNIGMTTSSMVFYESVYHATAYIATVSIACIVVVGIIALVLYIYVTQCCKKQTVLVAPWPEDGELKHSSR